MPSQSNNEVAKMKAKLERATPFGRSRRRLDDREGARMRGEGNMNKEVASWSGAKGNAYDDAKGGPLTKGHQRPEEGYPSWPKAEPKNGDRYGMAGVVPPAIGVPQSFGSEDLPLTFQTLKGQPERHEE